MVQDIKIKNMKQLNKKYSIENLNESTIENFEDVNKFILDNKFKEAIIKYQGCKVDEILFFDKSNEMWVLNAFFPFIEITQLYEEFLREYKQKLIPFAYDPGGWHFCLCMDEGADYGTIIINRWTDYLPEEQFLKIADTFEEFINGLKREDELQ